ncbi:hypothetical protein M33023_02330 [Candidatus Phytoplasma asteris]|uniref:Transmembrane protein n=1 Tax=Candidatus Phytoplasma asteris TaxID=85620 RepID=A0ABZ2YFZ0_9MOLU
MFEIEIILLKEIFIIKERYQKTQKNVFSSIHFIKKIIILGFYFININFFVIN